MKLSNKTLVKLRELINEGTVYRTGPDLIKFFSNLGFSDVYGQGFGSRKDYTDARLQKINGTPEMDKCLKLLFAPVEFIENPLQLDECISAFNAYLAFDGWKVIRNNVEISFGRAVPDIDGLIKDSSHETPIEVDAGGLEAFLKKQFEEINLTKILREDSLIDVLDQRLKELKSCLVDAPLASVLMAGSILECVLLSLGIANRTAFERASKAPRGKNVQDWNLSEYIDVAYELGYVMPDVYKFSSTLRQFRNYIHPHRQMMERFRPDSDTAHICFHVLKAAIAQINERL